MSPPSSSKIEFMHFVMSSSSSGEIFGLLSSSKVLSLSLSAMSHKQFIDGSNCDGFSPGRFFGFSYKDLITNDD